MEVAMSHRGRLSILVLLLSVLLVVLAVLPQTRFFLTGIFRIEHWYLGQPTSYWEEALQAEIQAGKKWQQEMSQSLQTTKKLPPAGKRPLPEIRTRLREGGENAFPVLVELLKVPDAELQQEVTWIMFAIEPNSQEMADSLASTLRFRTDGESVDLVMGKVMGYDRATGLAALREAIANNPDQNMRDHCESALARYEKNETAKQTPRAEEDDEKPAPAKISQSALDDLLKKYREIGLPLPPANSQLVRFHSGWRTFDEKGKETPLNSLGFLVKAGTKGKPALLLVGTELYEPQGHSDPEIMAVKPTGDLAKQIYPGWHMAFEVNAGLSTSIQCKARGWDELAQALWDESIGMDVGHGRGIFNHPANLSPTSDLYHVAWVHWANELLRPATDRAAISKRIEDLFKAEPGLATEPGKALLHSLKLALVPSKVKPGSAEALIDDLVDYNTNTGTMFRSEPGDRYRRIADLGFEAVPALIEHLDDERLTRALMTGFNNFPSYHLRVCDIVSDLIEGLAGQSLGRDWLRRQQGYEVAKAAAQAWWNEAQKKEEAYLLDHVLVSDSNHTEPYVSNHLLRLIQTKYPERIPSLYRKVLDERPEIDSSSLADAVLKSKLPDKEKLELLLRGAAHEKMGHRLSALWAIKGLDKKKFSAILLTTIDKTPEDIPGPYWTSRSPVSQHSQSIRTTPMSGPCSRRFNHLGDPKDNRHKLDRLRLLASFLDDSSSREIGNVFDMKGKFSGPCAGFVYPKLEVRDFAAMEVATLLGIEIGDKRERTAAEWAKIRETVREKLKKELGGKPTASQN
jgi:hypothetical protein